MDVLILYTEIHEAKHPSLLDCGLSLLSKNFQEQLSRYRRWEDAQLSLLGRLLIKEGMKYFNHEVNLKELKYTTYNKPYLEGSDIEFNISHSGEIVVLCMTYGNSVGLGIDIEKNHSIKVECFKDQMTQKEQRTVFDSKDPMSDFFVYWTQKEAILKAHGNGLSIPLKSFEIEDSKTLIDDDIFYVSRLELAEGYTCHIASKEKIDPRSVVIKKINADRFITS